MVLLNWTEQAAGDLINIRDFIAKDSPKYSTIHINRIKAKARLLKDYPKSGKIVHEIDIENMRELIFGNYRIIYRIVNIKQIDILTVFHSARELNSILLL
ncbi:MAG: type toxin-antitoxin system RelE/ParE family toxin [Ignavibacteria bacterium]|nr:type toxin-antitoxin system RelE/ParE family toxin [Ignavibacteria bacterium]